jgi:hypothetical protein
MVFHGSNRTTAIKGETQRKSNDYVFIRSLHQGMHVLLISMKESQDMKPERGDCSDQISKRLTKHLNDKTILDTQKKSSS